MIFWFTDYKICQFIPLTSLTQVNSGHLGMQGYLQQFEYPDIFDTLPQQHLHRKQTHSFP